MCEGSKSGMEHAYFLSVLTQFGSQPELGQSLNYWGLVRTRAGLIPQCSNHVDKLTEVILMGGRLKRGASGFISLVVFMLLAKNSVEKTHFTQLGQVPGGFLEPQKMCEYSPQPAKSPCEAPVALGFMLFKMPGKKRKHWEISLSDLKDRKRWKDTLCS